MRHSSIFTLLLGTALAGCTTTIGTTPVGGGMSSAGANAVVGMPYRLPAVSYSLVVTRTLVKCETAGGVLTPEFRVEVAATPEYIAGERFVADYRGLANWHKIGSSSIESHENGVIKSFNVAATDKSPEIITGAVKAVITAAKLAVGGGGPTVSAVKAHDGECPQALTEAQRLDAEMGPLARDIAADVVAQESLTKAAVLGVLGADGKKRLAALEERLAANRRVLAVKAAERADKNKLLVRRETYRLTPSASKKSQTYTFADPAALEVDGQRKWLEQLFGTIPTQSFADQTFVAVVVEYNVEDSGICASVGLGDGCGTVAKPAWDNSHGKPAKVPGLVVRDTARGALVICVGAEEGKCSKNQIEPAARIEGNIPQFGRLVVLPFHNGWGEDNELKASFRADGSVEKVSYDAKKASGEAAVKVVNDSLDVVTGLDTAIRDKQTAKAAAAKAAAADAAAAPQKAIDDQIVAAQHAKTLLDAQAAIDPTNLANAKLLADLNARLAQLQAQKMIDDLVAQQAD